MSHDTLLYYYPDCWDQSPLLGLLHFKNSFRVPESIHFLNSQWHSLSLTLLLNFIPALTSPSTYSKTKTNETGHFNSPFYTVPFSSLSFRFTLDRKTVLIPKGFKNYFNHGKGFVNYEPNPDTRDLNSETIEEEVTLSFNIKTTLFLKFQIYGKNL